MFIVGTQLTYLINITFSLQDSSFLEIFSLEGTVLLENPVSIRL